MLAWKVDSTIDGYCDAIGKVTPVGMAKDANAKAAAIEEMKKAVEPFLKVIEKRLENN